MKRVVTQTRIRKASERYTKHAELLKRVGKRFGVRLALSLLCGVSIRFWSGHGRIRYPALATLAHDGRRSTFFARN